MTLLTLKIVGYTVWITACALFGRWLYYRQKHRRIDPKFNIGDRVSLIDLYFVSQANSGGHMPWHGNIITVKYEQNRGYLYDVMPDYSVDGTYKHNVEEDSISSTTSGDKKPLTHPITSTISALVDI